MASVDQTPITVVNGKTLPAGLTTYGPLAIPKGATTIRPSMDASAHQDSSVLLTLTVEVSYDGGFKWQPFGNVSRPGGPALDDNGHADPNLWFEQNLPQPDNANRQMRGNLAVLNVDPQASKQPSLAITGSTIVYK